MQVILEVSSIILTGRAPIFHLGHLQPSVSSLGTCTFGFPADDPHAITKTQSCCQRWKGKAPKLQLAHPQRGGNFPDTCNTVSHRTELRAIAKSHSCQQYLLNTGSMHHLFHPQQSASLQGICTSSFQPAHLHAISSSPTCLRYPLNRATRHHPDRPRPFGNSLGNRTSGLLACQLHATGDGHLSGKACHLLSVACHLLGKAPTLHHFHPQRFERSRDIGTSALPDTAWHATARTRCCHNGWLHKESMCRLAHRLPSLSLKDTCTTQAHAARWRAIASAASARSVFYKVSTLHLRHPPPSVSHLGIGTFWSLAQDLHAKASNYHNRNPIRCFSRGLRTHGYLLHPALSTVHFHQLASRSCICRVVHDKQIQ
mmetsp:Transcript_70013/g.129062  ORF Transcript_70013/g.129062 Transcript_70013/m.129062 type:complete len:371 (-) Transcript_70013:96-1208(-)